MRTEREGEEERNNKRGRSGAMPWVGYETFYTAVCQQIITSARLAQSVERETLNLKVVGSTPTSGSIPGGS